LALKSAHVWSLPPGTSPLSDEVVSALIPSWNFASFFTSVHTYYTNTYMGQGWTDLCESSGAASGDPFVPFDFIASLSGHRLWQHSFLLFGHCQWRPLAFHIPA